MFSEIAFAGRLYRLDVPLPVTTRSDRPGVIFDNAGRDLVAVDFQRCGDQAAARLAEAIAAAINCRAGAAAATEIIDVEAEPEPGAMHSGLSIGRLAQSQSSDRYCSDPGPALLERVKGRLRTAVARAPAATATGRIALSSGQLRDLVETATSGPPRRLTVDQAALADILAQAVAGCPS